MKRYLSHCALAGALTIPLTVTAEDASVAPPPPPNRLSVQIGETTTSAYISRGRVLEDEGVIVQPYAQLNALVFQGEGLLSQVSVFGGIWNSLHSNHDFAAPGSSVPAWYEFDYYGGVMATLARNWTATLSYWSIVSPSDAFNSFNYVDLTLSYNDADLWQEHLAHGFALSPYAKLIIPTHGLAGTGSEKGQYLALGIAPGLTLMEKGSYPLRVALPTEVGLGFDKFYESDDNGLAPYTPTRNETFGFVSTGVSVNLPLTFVNHSGFGSWNVAASALYYQFGAGVRDFNALAVGRTSRDHEVVGALGLHCKF